MATFMIERNVPGASELTPEQLREIATTSNAVVDSLGVAYTWRHSYVAGDKIYCVHETDDAETVHEHARRGGFPADVVVAVAAVIGPETAKLDAEPRARAAASLRVRTSSLSRIADTWWSAVLGEITRRAAISALVSPSTSSASTSSWRSVSPAGLARVAADRPRGMLFTPSSRSLPRNSAATARAPRSSSTGSAASRASAVSSSQWARACS